MSELLTALGNLTANYEELAAVTLFSIGLCMLLFARNLIKKVIGLDIMDTGVFLLLASRGYISGRTVPIITDGVTDPARYINPIPAGLVLTGIVVSVSVSAVMLCSVVGGFTRILRDVAPRRRTLYWVVVDLAHVSLIALCYTNDIFTGYVFIEICTIAS